MVAGMTDAALRVLIVDDDPAYGRLAGLLLEEAHPGVVQTRTATTLAAALAAGPWEPGCVLLDLSLPDGGGLDAVARLRDGGVDAPVLVLSGRTDPGIADEAVARGAAAFLPKGRELDGGLAAAVAAIAPCPVS